MNNIINKFFLGIVLIPLRFYSKMGVDVKQLRSILIAKLIMDDRRPNTFQQTKRNKDGNVNMATLGTMLMSAVLGLIFLASFALGNDYKLQLTIYFSMFLFMLASSLITDFTSVLIDIRDNYIIMPKPVNDKTVVVGRLLHIMIHICKLVLPMSLPAIVYMIIKTSIAGTIAFVVLVILATILTIFFVNAVYILILKITTPQKFQSIISGFQIVFAIGLYAGYQVVPRLVDRVVFENYNIDANKWMWLVPSYWFATAWTAIETLSFTASGLVAIVLTFIVPFLSIWVVIKYFAPSFNQKLSLINSSNSESSTPAETTKKKTTSTTSAYVRAMAKALSKKGAERMAFLLSWKMTSRSKDFKMKVYPTIGYLVVMLLVPFIRSKNGYSRMLEDVEKLQFVFVCIIYFSSFLLIMAIGQLLYSDKYKAAWIYYTTPIDAPGEVISGALKSIIVKFYFPIVLLVTIAAVIIVGPSILPNLLLALFNQLFICAVITYLTVRDLPFSMQQTNNMKAGNFIKGLLTLIIPGIVALLHFFIYKFMPVVFIFIAMSLIAGWLIHGSIKKIAWQKISLKSRNYQG